MATPGLAYGGDSLIPFFDASASAAVETMKAAPGRLGYIEVYNQNATGIFLQLFDADTVTLGSTTPKLSLFVPGSSAIREALPAPFDFTRSIKYAVTATATGSTAPAAAGVLNAGYR
ncbi:MAG TPA: hypothetical protein VM938_10640 [Acidimicrobiales bacterium]|nr:hypothetical protein [Acidimicrobiales bacterium]